MKRVRIEAPAKINLILKVLNRRPDGYHNIWSLMHTVTLTDVLQFRLRPDTRAIRLRSDHTTMPTDDRNLIVRAASMVMERACVSIGLDIELTKTIPIGAGLGGGSSDAAATIVALSHLLRLGWSPEEMVVVGRSLGSDVPFFFSAPSGVVLGRGDQVTACQISGERWVVLVQPGFSIETKWAYEQLAKISHQLRPLSDEIKQIAKKEVVTWEEVIPLLENDFEQALASRHPVLGQVKSELLSQGADAALLSGSGSTVFGLFRTEAGANRARAALASVDGWRAATAQTWAGPLAYDDESSPGISPSVS